MMTLTRLRSNSRAFLKRALRPPNKFASNPPNDPSKQSADDRPMKDDDREWPHWRIVHYVVRIGVARSADHLEQRPMKA